MTRSSNKKSHSVATLKAVAISTVKPPSRGRPGAKAGMARKHGSDPVAVAIAEPQWIETLLDGTHVLIRPIQKTDTELERAFIKFLSPDARRMRFLGRLNEPSDDLLRCLTDIDCKHDMAFVALVHHEGETEEVGVSRYGTSVDGKSCECVVAVADAWRHRGLGVALMRHLIEFARARGIRKMLSFDAAENTEMHELAAFLGFERKADPYDATMVVHTLAL